MAVIKSGASTDQLTVDPTSKAARVTQYGTDGTALPGTSASATLQNNVSANGNGTALNVLGYSSAILTVNITGTATVNFEGSEDGTNYQSVNCDNFALGVLAGSTSTVGIAQWQMPIAGLQFIRARVSGVSGTPAVTVTAHAVQGSWNSRAINQAQIAGTATSVNAGATDAGTQRVTLGNGTQIIGALTANQTVNNAQVSGTATSVNTGNADAGTQRVVLASNQPAVSVSSSVTTAANVLVGTLSHTATTAAATIITIPAGRTWVGTIGISADIGANAASTTAGQALGLIATAGTGVTPAAGTVLPCEARAGANAATGTSGTQGSNSVTIPITVIAPAGNSVTLTGASTIAGSNGRVDYVASGALQ